MSGKFKSRQFAKRVNKHYDPNFRFSYFPEANLRELIKNKKSPLFIFLDGVQDPHNLGACIRTALGMDVDAVIIPKHRSVGVTETVNRVSCGAVEKVNIVCASNFSRLIEQLKEDGFWFVGLKSDSEQCVYDIDLTIPIAFVLGSEGEGLRKLTEKSMDYLVSLPMSNELESYNLSVSASICLYETYRQRVK